MSHSFRGGSGTTFSFNADLSGKVRIDPPGQPTIEVPGQDLIDLIAHYVVRQKILRLENADSDEILFGHREPPKSDVEPEKHDDKIGLAAAATRVPISSSEVERIAQAYGCRASDRKCWATKTGWFEQDENGGWWNVAFPGK